MNVEKFQLSRASKGSVLNGAVFLTRSPEIARSPEISRKTSCHVDFDELTKWSNLSVLETQRPGGMKCNLVGSFESRIPLYLSAWS